MKLVCRVVAAGAWLACALALAGCEVLQPKPPAPVASGPPQSVESVQEAQEAQEVLDLLAYYQRMLTLPADESRKEYANVAQLYARDKSDNTRLKLALLLSLPGASFRDDAKLIGLLEGMPARPGASDGQSPYRQLAALLLRTTQERGRLVREEQKRAEQLPRDDVKRVEELKEANRRLETQAADEKRRADELQKKLDALITIERELRSRGPQRKPN